MARRPHGFSWRGPTARPRDRCGGGVRRWEHRHSSTDARRRRAPWRPVPRAEDRGPAGGRTSCPPRSTRDTTRRRRPPAPGAFHRSVQAGQAARPSLLAAACRHRMPPPHAALRTASPRATRTWPSPGRLRPALPRGPACSPPAPPRARSPQRSTTTRRSLRRWTSRVPRAPAPRRLPTNSPAPGRRSSSRWHASTSRSVSWSSGFPTRWRTWTSMRRTASPGWWHMRPPRWPCFPASRRRIRRHGTAPQRTTCEPALFLHRAAPQVTEAAVCRALARRLLSEIGAAGPTVSLPTRAC